MEYQASITGKEIDRDWDGRASKTVTLQMTYAEALPLYDVSAPHRLWKEEFGPLLAQKAIFDFEP